MYRLRSEFVKGETVRFIGHLDILRTFERALRRAGLPVASSQGFNPRQKISFASPLPVGVTGERELVDIDMVDPVAPEDFVQGVNGALPRGLSFTRSCSIPLEFPPLMACLQTADYLAEWPSFFAGEDMAHSLELFLQSDEVNVIRRSKKGDRRVDIRPAVLLLEDKSLAGTPPRVYMRLLLSGEVTAKPSEVLGVLRDSDRGDVYPAVTRLQIGLRQ